MFDYLNKELDGREFESREEYEDTVRAVVDNAEYELGRAERWALGLNNESAEESLGITFKKGE